MTDAEVAELVARAKIISDMINMGEKIAWGADTEIIDTLVTALTQMQAERASSIDMQQAHEVLDAAADSFHRRMVAAEARAEAAEAERDALKIDASNHAADAETVRRERGALMAERDGLRNIDAEWAAEYKELENEAEQLIRAQRLRAESAEAERDRLRDALTTVLDHYTSLVNSGDCGFWNPEEEPTVIAARKALGPKP